MSESEPKIPRPPQRFLVRFPVEPKACRWCREKLVWTKTATGASMPLSWKSRIPVEEEGVPVGWSMIAHFVDCENWPKRKPKGRS